MNVFKDLKFLSYLDLAHYYPDNLNEINLKGFNNIKKLNLFYTYLTQTILNDVGKLKNLEELNIEIDNSSRNLDFKPLKNNENISIINIRSRDGQRGGDGRKLGKNMLKGFNNVKEFSFESIEFNQDAIDQLSKLTQVKKLKFDRCDFENVDIEPLNKLSNLKS
eukprot:jgi/Orpsp1_1/1189852/evm.model.d7180000074971.1